MAGVGCDRPNWTGDKGVRGLRLGQPFFIRMEARVAGDWIKIDTNLHEKPEVLLIAQLLSIDQFAVSGRLMRIWSWYDQHTDDGCCAQGATDAQLDALVLLRGFAEAMRKAGWLTPDNTIPKFDRHNGKTGKRRAIAAKTMRESRCANVARERNQTRGERRDSSSSPSTKYEGPLSDPARGGGGAQEGPISPLLRGEDSSSLLAIRTRLIESLMKVLRIDVLNRSSQMRADATSIQRLAHHLVPDGGAIGDATARSDEIVALARKCATSPTARRPIAVFTREATKRFGDWRIGKSSGNGRAI